MATTVHKNQNTRHINDFLLSNQNAIVAFRKLSDNYLVTADTYRKTSSINRKTATMYQNMSDYKRTRLEKFWKNNTINYSKYISDKSISDKCLASAVKYQDTSDYQRAMVDKCLDDSDKCLATADACQCAIDMYHKSLLITNEKNVTREKRDRVDVDTNYRRPKSPRPS
jgi:hypothetical protein